MERPLLRQLVSGGWILVALVALYVAWTFGSRWLANRQYEARFTRPSQPYTGAVEAGGVRILHFYADRGVLVEGERAIVCYGVRNAAMVRIDPGVPAITPSPNRCLQVAPEEDTKYTLTALGQDGRAATASFEIQVQPDPALQPKIAYFVDRTQKKQRVRDAVGDVSGRGRPLHQLCFFANNTEEITIEPPVFPPMRGIDGCFYVTPAATTTYTLTATGRKGRKAHKQLTIRVE